MDKINSNIYKKDYARFNFREEFSNSCNLNDKKTKKDKIEELVNNISNIDKVNDKYHSIKLYINDKLVETPSLDIIEKFSLQQMLDEMKKRCNPNEADYKKHGWNRNHYSYMCPCGSCKDCNNLVSKRFCADLVNQPINYFEEKTMPVNDGARKCVDNACRHPNVICKDCSKEGVNTGIGFVDKAVDSTAKTFEDGWKYVKGGVEDITKWASNTASDVGGGVVQTISTAERVSNEIKDAAKYGTKEVLKRGNDITGGIEDIHHEIISETTKAMLETGKFVKENWKELKNIPLIFKCGESLENAYRKQLSKESVDNSLDSCKEILIPPLYILHVNKILLLRLFTFLFSKYFSRYMGKYKKVSEIAPPGYFDFSIIIEEYKKILESKTSKLSIELNEEYEKIINEVYESFEKTKSKEELKEKIEEFKLNYKEGKYSSLTKESTFSAQCVDFDLLGNDKQKEELKNRSEFDIEKKMLCSGESKLFNKYTVVRSIHNVITPSEYNNIIRYTKLSLDNYKPIDCEGNYKPCNEECNIEFEAYQKPKFGGKECPSSIKCLPGEDKCQSKPRDCKEAYGKCRNVNGECIKRNIIYQTPYGGKACKNENWKKCDKEDEGCPINCVGSWDKCKLKKLNNGDDRCVRTFKIDNQSKFGGSFCDSVNNEIQLCKSGEDECPPDIDCKGIWSRCNENCKKIFKIITPKSGNGYECRYRNGQTVKCNGDECKTESKLNRPKIEKPIIYETEYDFVSGSVNIANDGSIAPVSIKRFSPEKDNNFNDESNSNNKLITYFLLLLVILFLVSLI